MPTKRPLPFDLTQPPTGEEWLVVVLGFTQRVFEIFSSKAGPDVADAFALEQVNYLRVDASLPEAKDPSKWQEALDEWRTNLADQLFGDSTKTLDNDDDVVISVRQKIIRVPNDIC